MRAPMMAFGLVSVLNMLISGGLVYGIGGLPRMGIDGILIGTIVARLSGALLIVGILIRGYENLHVRARHLRLRRATVQEIVRIGGPAALDGMFMWVGQFLFLMVVARSWSEFPGDVTIAAHMIGIRVEAISYLPAVAWGAAVATIVGQNLGAGQPERARAAANEAVRQGLWPGIAITAVFYFGAGWIFATMHHDPHVGTVGVPAFQLLAFFQVPLVISIIYVQALRGAGATRLPMFVTVIGVFVVRVPVAWLGGVVLKGGWWGAWTGMCADMLLRAVLLGIAVQRGGWVATRVGAVEEVGGGEEGVG
jgi:Na+-driven multidrug efflux pump